MANVKTYGNYKGTIIRYLENVEPDGGVLELVDPETGMAFERSCGHARFWPAVKEGKATIDAMWAARSV